MAARAVLETPWGLPACGPSGLAPATISAGLALLPRSLGGTARDDLREAGTLPRPARLGPRHRPVRRRCSAQPEALLGDAGHDAQQPPDHHLAVQIRLECVEPARQKLRCHHTRLHTRPLAHQQRLQHRRRHAARCQRQ
ncbi:hypothetical protein DL89DRAFT_142644 [Linderina pennispora]|uniref:Uncharacterized protein n=1 Tax=Linderina pennispora TaxID=61395 RepID=A0A1Y1WC24_9FUNG|nr:uncharacterized protein DL89DRAFT_142644 [Linderina pennispora]ORX70878.1 hypothetical protein DL89DRAFT_142644 [Linderina pennispora]